MGRNVTPCTKFCDANNVSIEQDAPKASFLKTETADPKKEDQQCKPQSTWCEFWRPKIGDAKADYRECGDKRRKVQRKRMENAKDKNAVRIGSY